MRIAVVHPYPVHSRAVGGTTRVNGLVRFLAARHDVTVLAHSSGNRQTDELAVSDLADCGVRQSLFELPRADLASRLRWIWADVPYFVRYNRNPALETTLRDLDRRKGLDVVHVEFAYLAPLLGRPSSRAAAFLAEQETMSLAISRLAGLPPWRRSAYENFLVTQRAKVSRFEARALRQFSRVYAISPEEAKAMSRAVGREVEVLPHVVNTAAFSPPLRDVQTQPKLLYVGNYAHRPNLHALMWFVTEVWAGVRAKIPDAVLDVVGPGLTGRAAARLQHAGIRVLGRVEDLATSYRNAAVFINPIRSGGGMRGKVLEAFASGCAVVSTAMGMEGIQAISEEHFLQADDPRAFAAQTIRYLHDADLRRVHGTNARRLVEESYDSKLIFTRIEQAYEACVANGSGCGA